jgi:hypothetical protein
MSFRLIKRSVLGLCLGFVFGVLMLILAAVFEKDKGVMNAWNVVHKPALLLADWWTESGLPPSGEASWVIPPCMMVLAQWSLLGLMAGFSFGLRTSRKHDNK